MPTPLSRLIARLRQAPATRQPLCVNTIAALWMGGAGNLALWLGLVRLDVLSGWQGTLFGAAVLLMIAAAVVALTSLVSWRGLHKPMLGLLLLASAVATHFMLAYGTVIDPGMITNVLETDRRETLDLLTDSRFILTLSVLGIGPLWLLWRTPIAYVPWPRQALHNVAAAVAGVAASAVLAVAAYQPLSSTVRNHHHVRYLVNPLNSVYGLGRALAGPMRGDAGPLQPVGRDATLALSHTAQTRPPLLLLVVGETARSGNFGINGYARNTTPELAVESVVSWRNAWSCGTDTATSVPCMFSHLGRSGFGHRGPRYENLLDVLQHAGLAVLWLDNQAGCKGVCARVASVSTSASDSSDYCADGECHDAVMLQGLDERIAALPAPQRERGVVLVMHQMGGHGPAYFKRSPAAFKRFMPECTSSALQQCSREQVVNAYDNTIVYTDHFLASGIHWLKRQAGFSTAMLYVADHGESLGEGNLYLHGLPYALAPDVQKRVPWITWVSPAFAQRRGIDVPCLAGRAELPVSHDNYFHSVLGLLDVQTQAYQVSLDAYAVCTDLRNPTAGAHTAKTPSHSP